MGVHQVGVAEGQQQNDGVKMPLHVLQLDGLDQPVPRQLRHADAQEIDFSRDHVEHNDRDQGQHDETRQFSHEFSDPVEDARELKK